MKKKREKEKEGRERKGGRRERDWKIRNIKSRS